MRKIITLLAVTLAVLSAQSQKRDTIKTILFYSDPVSDELKLDMGFRVIKDTMKFVRVDAETFKRRKVVDTSYFIPVLLSPVDSVTKKTKVDSLGNPIQIVQYFYVPPSTILIDAGKNVDEIIKTYLASRPKQDANKPK